MSYTGSPKINVLERYLGDQGIWILIFSLLIISIFGRIAVCIYYYDYRKLGIYKAIKKDQALPTVTEEEAKALRAARKKAREERRMNKEQQDM